jgi:hypothetical protein
MPTTEQSPTNDQGSGNIPNDETTRTMPESPRPNLYSLNEMDEEFNIHDADAWLASLEGDVTNEWLQGTVETARSPPTSLATDTRTALGHIYKGCRCPSHQEIYSNWPYHNAELTIAQCMKICVYCGKDFQSAAELRKHMKKSEYARRNLRIQQETKGKWSSTTPAWVSIQRSDSEPLISRPTARMTRSQSVTNSVNGPARLW